MASGNKKAQKDAETLAASSLGKTQSIQDALMKPTEGQAALDARNLSVLNNKGDWGANNAINYAGGSAAAGKSEALAKNRGAYTFGAQYADPNLLSALNSQEAANAGQYDALSKEAAISDAINNASNSVLQSGQLTTGRQGAALGSAQNLYGNSVSRADQLRQTNANLWPSIIGQGLSAAGSIFAPIKLPFG